MMDQSELTVLTVTLKGAAVMDPASTEAVFFSEEPGILRRRPVRSEGDSAHTNTSACKNNGLQTLENITGHNN